MPKNIVLCFDGTSNHIDEKTTNVLKLYRTLEKGDDQVCFYDQGIGALNQARVFGRFTQNARHVVEQAVGLGLTEKIVTAYRFLIEHWEEGDQIYLFGFSRGAHSARVFAGLLFEIGVIKREEIHLAEVAYLAYRNSKRLEKQDKRESEGVNFRRIMQPRKTFVHFLGLFDTVSSVLVPNNDSKFYFPPLARETLLHTAENPSVRTVRHAVAIDERRRMFRHDPWTPSEALRITPPSNDSESAQDAREVWFAGYHGDVGGGWGRGKDGAAQIPLAWMLDEADAAGLRINGRMRDYVTGLKPYSSTTNYLYDAPDARAPLNNSMNFRWRVAEWLPWARPLNPGEEPSHWSKRVRIPNGAPRFIPNGALVHASVEQRLADGDYKPPNLPNGREIVG